MAGRGRFGRIIIACLLTTCLAGSFSLTIRVGSATAAEPHITDLSTGYHHACAVTDDHQVWCWGSNTHGQSDPPEGEYVSVSASLYHSCGLRTDGTIACWGSWVAGAADAPAGEFVAVSTGHYYNCAIAAADASAVCWNDDGISADPPSGEFAAISVGANGHACGLDISGTVHCWGNNSSGQAPPTQTGTWVEIAAGGAHTCALDESGAPTCWGNQFYGQATAVGGPYVSLSLGQEHSCGLDGLGELTCWGYTLEGQTQPPAGPFTLFDADGVFDCGVRDPLDEVECWGAQRAPYVLPGMISNAPPKGTVGTLYNHAFHESFAKPARTFAVTAGSLPPGISLVGNSMTGTPTEAGTYADITITAQNGVAPSISQSFTMVIDPAPPPTSTPTATPTPTPTPTPPPDEPSDIAGHPFANDIRWLYATGITGGCSATAFCPNLSVTREQMASFLRRALNLPPATRDYFTDDESSAHEGDINRLAASKITGGCGGTRFCPRGPVTRAQMASFLARALQLPATTSDFFDDDDGSMHEADINRLAAAGITGGCAARRFCSSANVTRGQMAAFLHRAFD